MLDNLDIVVGALAILIAVLALFLVESYEARADRRAAQQRSKLTSIAHQAEGPYRKIGQKRRK